MYKVDLHTHSSLSHDGGLTSDQYYYILEQQILDAIAITDHNVVDFALHAQKTMGEDRIIVGEEIMTSQGEIIGLYLHKTIPAGLSAKATVENIKAQGGLVYIPHPFETMRQGLHPEAMDALVDKIDIIEVCNGRAFLQNRGQQAVVWARLNHKPGAASSDAHGINGIGKTFNNLAQTPSRENLCDLLLRGTIMTQRPKLRALLDPKINRFKKKYLKT